MYSSFRATSSCDGAKAIFIACARFCAAPASSESPTANGRASSMTCTLSSRSHTTGEAPLPNGSDVSLAGSHAVVLMKLPYPPTSSRRLGAGVIR